VKTPCKSAKEPYEFTKKSPTSHKCGRDTYNCNLCNTCGCPVDARKSPVNLRKSPVNPGNSPVNSHKTALHHTSVYETYITVCAACFTTCVNACVRDCLCCMVRDMCEWVICECVTCSTGSYVCRVHTGVM